MFSLGLPIDAIDATKAIRPSTRELTCQSQCLGNLLQLIYTSFRHIYICIYINLVKCDCDKGFSNKKQSMSGEFTVSWLILFMMNLAGRQKLLKCIVVIPTISSIYLQIIACYIVWGSTISYNMQCYYDL